MRAWEVLETSGKPISFWHTNRLPPLISVDNSTRCVLNISKGKLDSLNSERFKKMLTSGAVEECNLAKKNGMTPICQSFKAIGVSEIFQYLDGHINLDEAEETSIIRTRQFSKRQMTWFRNNFNDWDWYNVEKLNHSQIAKMIITNINKL